MDFKALGSARRLLTKTLLLAMRLTAILLLAASLHVSASGWGQTVTLSVKNVPIQKVFREIFRQTGISVIYNEALFEGSTLVTLEVKNAGIDQVLRACFRNLPLTYTIADGTILLKRADSASAIQDAANAPPALIHGRVTGGDGRPLQGVSVTNKQTKKGGSTNSEGIFAIGASAGDVLSFSFVGYKSEVRKVMSPDAAIDVTMEIAVSSLNETVVIGYGTSQRKDLTGSVSTVSSKDIQDIPFTTVDNALAGKAAGVQVTKTDGTPGGAVRIRVRGSTSLLGGNDPLYVIDGVPMQVQSNYLSPGYDVGSPMANAINGSGGLESGMSTAFTNGLNSLGGLNVDDIESITILKDASSTAIYGSKAANGVVIITTKKGRKEMQPRITFNYYGTLTSIERKPKLLDAAQYKTLLTEAAQNDNDAHDLAGAPHYAITDQITGDPSSFFGKANTNWLDVVTRSPFANNAELAVQGGSASSRYYTSIAYNSTPGVVIGTDYQRISGKVTLENEIGKRFKFVTNLNIGYTDQNITNGAYDQAIKARPDYTPYDSSGNFTSFANIGASYQGFENPLALTTAINNSRTTSILGSISAIYDFNPHLQFKSTASINNQSYNQRLYTPSYIAVGSSYGPVPASGGIGNNANSRFTDLFVENTIGYTKTWSEKSSINVLAGTSYETQETSSFSATATGYPNDNVLNNLSSAIIPLYSKGDDPSKPQSYLLSYYLRANYSFRDRYLLTFTGRADGSSKFGPENKFGYFPSGAIAWRLSKEKWLRDISWIEDIKIRASYGLTGNQNIGDQMYRSLYTPTSYAGTNALIPTQLGNPGIKWETTKQTDIGADVSLFGGRLQATVDHYQKQTGDALLSLPLPTSAYYPSLLDNVVGIRNSGLELSMQGDIIRTADFRWSASFNVTWNKSIVTQISSSADLTQIGSKSGLEYGNTAIIKGQPLGLITGMKVTGIIKTQQQLDAYKSALGQNIYAYPYLGIGDPMFLLDTVNYQPGGYPFFNAVVANGAPKYYGGFTQGFGYKNFDLNLYFTFSQGGNLMWGDGVSSLVFLSTANANTVMLNRYNAANTNATQPRLLYSDQILYNSNLSVYKSSYVKLRTVSLSYKFTNTGWLKNRSVQSASLYASATNLFTITKYPGNDPETSDDSYSVQGGYFDVSNYPGVRTFSLGLKVGF